MSAFPELRDPEKVLSELVSVCSRLRSEISRLPPKELIGYLWARVLLSLIAREEPDTDQLPPVSSQENVILFAMEYVHATIACDGIGSESQEFSDTAADKIIDIASESLKLSFEYQITLMQKGELQVHDSRLAFQILSTWIMIRGRRFQVMEEEFFGYVLKPHDEALEKVYGISSTQLAKELQRIADLPRTGFVKAQQELDKLMSAAESEKPDQPSEAHAGAESPDLSPDIAHRAAMVFDDLFRGGLFNLTKHTGLPEALLADLSYKPGENQEFNDGSPIGGTPFKTLPAKLKPLIEIDGEYFCSDPNFIRDSTYRTLQRALVVKDPSYRELWNVRQKEMSERAFSDIMGNHLKGSSIYTGLFYPIGPRQYAETDSLIILGDVLINVEAKAGAEALSAPSENLTRHMRAIEKLVLESHSQCCRLVEYLFSAKDVPFYEKLDDGKFREVLRVRAGDFRKIFPIGLTVEAFTPFSAGIKEQIDTSTSRAGHHFISMSIDDLFVIRRILRSTGEFLHYLDVRQSIAAIRNVMLFDEIDHLGAYVSKNRADQRILEIMRDYDADHVWVDGMDQDVIAPYFMNPDWPDCPIPSQEYPEKVLELLGAIEFGKDRLWLDADAYIRDFSGTQRKELSDALSRTAKGLSTRPFVMFALYGEETAVFGLLRADSENNRTSLRRRAEAMCLALDLPRLRFFVVTLTKQDRIAAARMEIVTRPPIVRADFAELQTLASRMKEELKNKGVRH